MRRSLGKELDDAPIEGEDKFESPNHEKGMRPGDLPEGIQEDQNNRLSPTRKGDIVKDTNRTHKAKKKNPIKWPCTTKEASEEEVDKANEGV